MWDVRLLDTVSDNKDLLHSQYTGPEPMNEWDAAAANRVAQSTQRLSQPTQLAQSTQRLSQPTQLAQSTQPQE